MKKTLIALIALFITATSCFAQSHTEEDLAVNKFQMLFNTDQSANIYNMLSGKIQSMMTLEKTMQAMKQLHTQVGDLKSYSFTKQEQQLCFYKASFAKMALTFVVSLGNDKRLEAFRFIPFKDESEVVEKSNFVYHSPDGDIFGSLVMPEGTTTPVPVVLIIAGSGPTDRNCNQASMTCNAFKMLADSLQKAGIASVRYDKRGVGESAASLKDQSKVVFEDMVNDATGFVRMLKGDKRFSKVIVLGHSEGSLIGMIAAKREKADAYISVAGIGQRADKVVVKQLAVQSTELSIKAKVILDSLVQGHTVKNIDENLTNIFDPSVQPYIISWLKYDPQAEIKKLTVPVLILQGTTDIQVSVSEAELLKKASPKATYTLIPGMNHPLKTAPEDRTQNMATYNNPTLPLCAGFVPAVVAFVKK